MINEVSAFPFRNLLKSLTKVWSRPSDLPFIKFIRPDKDFKQIKITK